MLAAENMFPLKIISGKIIYVNNKYILMNMVGLIITIFQSVLALNSKMLLIHIKPINLNSHCAWIVTIWNASKCSIRDTDKMSLILAIKWESIF